MLTGASPSESAAPELEPLRVAQGFDAAAEFEEHDPRTCLCNNMPSPCVDCRAVFDRQRAERAAAPLARFDIVSVRRSLAAATVRREGH